VIAVQQTPSRPSTSIACAAPVKPASCLLCVLLFGAAVHAQAPSPNRSVQGPNAHAAAGQSAPPQNAGGQNYSAQNPAAQQVVPVSNEPHHRLVLQNDFVHVFNVSVPPLDATLTHQHDLPYFAVFLGPADLVNLVLGKLEAHLTLQDGQVIFSPGGFAHLVRTDSGIAFHNITVELAKPQGIARNICKQIVTGPLGACPQQAAPGKKTAPAAADDDIPYFETDEVRVDLIKVAGGRDYVEEMLKLNALLIALTNANLNVNLGGQHISFLHDSDILWLPAGTHRKVVDFLGTRSSFLLASFKDSAGGAKP
jgi:hypothetical protein